MPRMPRTEFSPLTLLLLRFPMFLLLAVFFSLSIGSVLIMSDSIAR